MVKTCFNNIKPKILFIAGFIFLFTHLKSQISPLYYRHNNFEQFINPAITGRDHHKFLNISNKKYWFGTDYSPYSVCAGASGRLGTHDFYNPTMMLNKTDFLSRNRMGFGALVMYETDGPISFFTSKLTYAYYLPLSKNKISELSFGLAIDISHFSINENLFEPLDEGDPELLQEKNKIYPESDFGIYYHNEQFQVGASVNELFQSKILYENNEKNSRDFFFQTGYKFYLKWFEFEPFIFAAKINDRPLYLFNQLKLYYKNYNWVAFAYSTTHKFTGSFGFRVRRMTLGYAYESNMSKLQSYFGGSHEIMLGYNIGLFEPEGIKKTLRVGK